MTDSGSVLTVVVCGAGPAAEVGELVTLAQGRGWRVGVVATGAALPFLDVPALEAQTGVPVRTEQRAPGAGQRALPDATAIIVAPATFNTVCKLSAGIADTYPLTLLAEAIGRGVPVVVLPFVNSALAGRRPFADAVASLRGEGVRVLFGPGAWEPHPPGGGGDRIASFPWTLALDSATER